MKRPLSLVLPALLVSLAAAAPAAAGPGDAVRARPGEAPQSLEHRAHDRDACSDDDCDECRGHGGRPVWIRGHWEDRVEYVRIPAVHERRLVPARCEQVWIPPVWERVWIEPVCRDVWVEPVCERVLVPAVYETICDGLGRPHRFCRRAAYYETRVVRAGHWERRVVVPGRTEERVVTPGRYETRILEPERWETVCVRPECTEKRVTRVWVPGRWESVARR